jgi:hypothetical protein
MEHPYICGAHSFRFNVNYLMLQQILEDPTNINAVDHCHTDAACQHNDSSDMQCAKVESEESAIRRQLSVMQPQVDALLSRLVELKTARTAEKNRDERKQRRTRSSVMK